MQEEGRGRKGDGLYGPFFVFFSFGFVLFLISAGTLL